VHVRDGRGSQLGRSPERNEAALLFSIQDTGIGIPAARQAAIFNAFEQVETPHAVNYGGGVGLGLAIASRLVGLMDGLDAMRAIRKLENQSGRHTQVVAMTAFAMHGDRERLLAAGMNGYLSKPIKTTEVMAVLTSCRAPSPSFG